MKTLKFSNAVCQSCGSPIRKESEQGTESGGGLTDLYCGHCYRFGAFTEPGMTVNEMKENIRHRMLEMQFPRFLAVLLADRVHTLKRWEIPKA